VFRTANGKEIDNLIYFTLYDLGKVADSFKQFGPHHQPIHYDRTKCVSRVYTVISNEKDLAAMKKGGKATEEIRTNFGVDLLIQDNGGYSVLWASISSSILDLEFLAYVLF
jgi:hypothetical protein